MDGGLVEPPIDDLLAKTDSKYTLSVLAAKRAREINSYLTQLNEGLLEHVGPLVEYDRNAKENPLNIAMREIYEGAIMPGEPKPESEVAADISAGVAPDVTQGSAVQESLVEAEGVVVGEAMLESEVAQEVAADISVGVAPDVTLVGGDAAAATGEVDAPGESKSQAQDDVAESA